MDPLIKSYKIILAQRCFLLSGVGKWYCKIAIYIFSIYRVLHNGYFLVLTIIVPVSTWSLAIMPTAKITKTTVDALQPQRRSDGSLADGYLWDTELKGFACKATPAGKKIFLVQYRLGGRTGKTQRVTLGPHGKLTVDQARKRSQVELGRIAAGQDPAGD